MPRPQAVVFALAPFLVAVLAALLLVRTLYAGNSVGVPEPIVVETSEVADEEGRGETAEDDDGRS